MKKNVCVVWLALLLLEKYPVTTTSLPLFFVKQDIDDGKLISIVKDHKIEPETLYVVRLSRRFTPSKVRVMVDYLKQAFKK